MTNKEAHALSNKKWFAANHEREISRNRKWKEENPWATTLSSIKNRCTNPNMKNYKNYGGKGIECQITSDELKLLYIRDQAHLMIKASIDRIDSSKHYVFDNCRYIEMEENRKRARYNDV